jgi:hypothetical protein
MYDRRRDLPGWHHLRDGRLVSKGGRGGRKGDPTGCVEIVLPGCGIVGVGPARAERDGTHSDLGDCGVGIGCAVLVL